MREVGMWWKGTLGCGGRRPGGVDVDVDDADIAAVGPGPVLVHV
jgi:hypothetical protein